MPHEHVTHGETGELQIEGDKDIYSAPLQKIQGTIYMLIPVDAQNHLNLEKQPIPAALKLMIEDGPHGKYLSVWNNRQQTENQRKQDTGDQ